jgi:DNA-binding SARP family transcriptional activator
MRAMQAVALYRGEFLQDVVVQAGDPFAAWLENNRRAIHKMAVACLRHLLCSGEASESIARRLIDLVPNSEEAHIWLLRHSAERGDVAQAFERYHSYVDCAAPGVNRPRRLRSGSTIWSLRGI